MYALCPACPTACTCPCVAAARSPRSGWLQRVCVASSLPSPSASDTSSCCWPAGARPPLVFCFGDGVCDSVGFRTWASWAFGFGVCPCTIAATDFGCVVLARPDRSDRGVVGLLECIRTKGFGGGAPRQQLLWPRCRRLLPVSTRRSEQARANHLVGRRRGGWGGGRWKPEAAHVSVRVPAR